MKVATVWMPPPNPSERSVTSNSGKPMASSTARNPSTVTAPVNWSKKSMKAPPRLIVTMKVRYMARRKIGMARMRFSTSASMRSVRVRDTSRARLTVCRVIWRTLSKRRSLITKSGSSSSFVVNFERRTRSSDWAEFESPRRVSKLCSDSSRLWQNQSRERWLLKVCRVFSSSNAEISGRACWMAGGREIGSLDISGRSIFSNTIDFNALRPLPFEADIGTTGQSSSLERPSMSRCRLRSLTRSIMFATTTTGTPISKSWSVSNSPRSREVASTILSTSSAFPETRKSLAMISSSEEALKE